jgi:hypothetical protein
MKTYQEKQAEAREQAITWQLESAGNNYSYAELCDFYAHFEKLGRRYGLLKEFRTEGII